MHTHKHAYTCTQIYIYPHTHAYTRTCTVLCLSGSHYAREQSDTGTKTTSEWKQWCVITVPPHTSPHLGQPPLFQPQFKELTTQTHARTRNHRIGNRDITTVDGNSDYQVVVYCCLSMTSPMMLSSWVISACSSTVTVEFERHWRVLLKKTLSVAQWEMEEPLFPEVDPH